MTKPANLRLEDSAYSLLHFLYAIEGRPKADIVGDALREYAAKHHDRLAGYTSDLAAAAGLPLVVPTASASAVERVRARVGARKSALVRA